MEDHELWQLMTETWRAITPHYETVIHSVSSDVGMEIRSWGLLMAALTFEPEHTTSSHLLVRMPYMAAEKYLQRLKALASKGHLEEVALGEFKLSTKGRALAYRFISEARQAMVAADPLTKKTSLRLAVLLDKLVQSCLKVSPPPNTWSIRLSYQLMPEIDPPLPFIEQAFSCFLSYRDDAHLAAWQLTGLSATALESLTLIWKKQVGNLTSLVDHLNERGHSVQIYQAALDELREKQFITGSDDEFVISERGNAFRNKVETDTNRYFFKPWNSLSVDDKKDMVILLIQLKEGLTGGIDE